MQLDLAFANLWASKSKTAISLAGVGTSIVLIFMQLGFRGAVENTATMIYDQLEFDLVIRSPDYLHLADAATFDRDWLTRIQGQPAITSVKPLWTGMGSWRDPHDEELHGLLLLGVDPQLSIFSSGETAEKLERLDPLGALLIDRESHPDLGPRNGQQFSNEDRGVVTHINGVSVTIADTFQMGAGLTANGAAIVSERQFGKLLPIPVSDRTSLGLIKLAPGRSPTRARDELQQWVNNQSVGAPAVEVLTRAEVLQLETRRWIRETPIGFIFTLGVGISFVVGAAIVYSVMSNDVNRRLGEFATLKAMGYSNWMVCGIVVRQAIYLGAIAFVPSFIISWGLYQITAALAAIPIEMQGSRIGLVLVLSLAMASLSGLLALRRVWGADPATLF